MVDERDALVMEKYVKKLTDMGFSKEQVNEKLVKIFTKVNRLKNREDVIQNNLIDDFTKGSVRNQLCVCGSGKKIKKCDCMKDESKK